VPHLQIQIARGVIDEGGQRRSVSRPIDQLDELPVFEALEDAEKPILRAGCD
jgi:hypothetical protein